MLSALELDSLLADRYETAERGRLVRLMTLIASLPPPPDPVGLYPRYAEHAARFAEAGPDPDAIEERFLALYAHLHGSEAPYTPEERARMDEAGGYWCHAGGLSPILRAGPHIHPGTVSGDFGAGNGLQLLLLQALDPHRLSIQIEISSRLVEAGRALQSWLGIEEGRVRWIAGDVLDHTPDGMDFVHIYRPVRPEGPGRAFYERFAESLSRSDRPVVVFSIADCLRAFLPPSFEVFYFDGHLTCFRKPVDATIPSGEAALIRPPRRSSRARASCRRWRYRRSRS